MPFQIGRAPSGEAGDLFDLLLSCHERIRTHANLARRLGEAIDPDPDEVRDAALRVRRYFREALPLHVRDEEETVAPRLRGRSAELDAALAEMSGEHEGHEHMLSRLLELCGTLESAPERHGELAASLREVGAALERELGAHLEREERDIFPAIRAELGEGERAAMVAELRRRRRA